MRVAGKGPVQGMWEQDGGRRCMEWQKGGEDGCMEWGFVIPLHRLSGHGMNNDTLPKLACPLPNALLNAEKLWAAESLPYEQWGSEQCSRSPWGGSPTCCRCQHKACCRQHCSHPYLPCQGFVASNKVGVLGGTTSSQKLSAENIHEVSLLLLLLLQNTVGALQCKVQM